MIRWIIVISIFLIIELYAYQAIRTLFKPKWISYSYIVLTLVIIAYLIYSFLKFDRTTGQDQHSLFVIGLFLMIQIPKIIVATILIGEDVFRLGYAGIKFLVDNNTYSYFKSRSVIVSVFASGLGVLLFFSLMYGILIGKYNYKVHKSTIYYENLPQAFDGFKIVQISDVHSGSLSDKEKISAAIDLLNNQQPDVVFLTGDLVNNFAKEVDPWVEVFSKIKKPHFGKYAVLGNHDYGEYTIWKTPSDKQDNFNKIKQAYKDIGFNLLLNESVYLEKENDKIAVIGVENWGHNFKKAGDLALASRNIKHNDFKILLSHDPSHWDKEVKHHPNKYDLTLSGHTHGMQFGLEIADIFKWSPVQYVYKQWAGLYSFNESYLYVNRGFGFHAYSGRVGIWPEITVIELKKK